MWRWLATHKYYDQPSQHSNGGCLKIFLSSEFVRMIYRISYLPHQGCQKPPAPLNNRFIIATGIKIELFKIFRFNIRKSFDKVWRRILIRKLFASSSHHMCVWRYLATFFSTPIDLSELVKIFGLQGTFWGNSGSLCWFHKDVWLLLEKYLDIFTLIWEKRNIGWCFWLRCVVRLIADYL